MPTIALKLKDKDMTKDILREIAPLQNGDFLYIADRHKTCFDYPIHTHDVFELNFVAGAKGVNRLFRKRKGCSPTEFREKYFKTKVII